MKESLASLQATATNLIRRMIHDKIHDVLHVTIMETLDQGLDIFHGPIWRVDAVIIGNIISHVHLGGLKDRRKPDDIDTEILQIIQLGNNTRDISNTISIRILEGGRVNLVDRLFPPPVTMSCDFASGRHLFFCCSGRKKNSMGMRSFKAWYSSSRTGRRSSTKHLHCICGYHHGPGRLPLACEHASKIASPNRKTNSETAAKDVTLSMVGLSIKDQYLRWKRGGGLLLTYVD